MNSLRRLVALCRGDSECIVSWLDEREPRWLLTCIITITAGCALYGGVIGWWRAPQQAVYAAIKSRYWFS
jgi:hypothetical protein